MQEDMDSSHPERIDHLGMEIILRDFLVSRAGFVKRRAVLLPKEELERGGHPLEMVSMLGLGIWHTMKVIALCRALLAILGYQSAASVTSNRI